MIPDSVVEAACRAFFNNDSNPDWEKLGERVRRMRAALEAAAPMIRDQPHTCPECKGTGMKAVVVDREVTYPMCHVCYGKKVIWQPLPQPPKETK